MMVSKTSVGATLLVILVQQGLAQDRAGAVRIRAWEDGAAVRLLDQAKGTIVPEKAAERIVVEHPRFAQAIRASSTTSGSENKWNAQLRWTTKEPIAKGDVVVVAFSLRGVQGRGHTFVAFGTARPPHVNALARCVDVDQQWQDFQFPILARQDYAAGEAKLAIGFGAAVQRIDVGRVEVFKFKSPRRVWDFVDSSSYRGIEPDAAWRKAALERIEKSRKAEIRVEVVDAGGKPVPQSAVNLRMTAHAFRFGSSFNPHVYRLEKEYPDQVRAYEKRFLEYFNVATPEAVMSWRSWENPESRACLFRAMDFLAAQRIPVIGHPLVWQAPKTLPESLHTLIRDRDFPAYLARWNAHLAEKVHATRGRFCEHLVINEFVDTNFLPEAMTDDAIVGWYRLVREHDPRARLGILEHKMICNGAADADKTLPWYESKIEMLLKNHVPLELIAFQGHFRDHLTEPERLLEILDRFARYKLPLQVTEFDVEMDDELLQADYLRDFFIACFSHPSVELIQQWGFWEKSHWRPRAALFREDWTPKPNGRQFLDLVLNQWMTRETGTTGADGRFAVRGFLGEYEVDAEKDGRVARGRFTLPKGGHTLRLVLDTTAVAGSIRLGDRTEAVTVAVAPGATPREQLAAQAIVDYLARISGKRLQRQEIADGRVPPGLIAVGRLAKDAGLVSQEELDATARDGYVVKVAAGRAAVCGGRDLGTLYGAYGLLRQLGVKFYAQDCEVVPAIPKLVLPEGITKVQPRYDLLGFYSLLPFFGLEPNVKLGHTPHDDHGNIRGPHDNDPAGHTSDFLVPYKTYGKEHPEHFALLKDGQRLHAVPGKRFDVHLCLSNPEVRRISTERLLGLIESQKERTYFIVTQGDGYDWCQCDACKALDAVPGDDMTDRLLDYVNHIARAVAKKYPDKLLMTAAYTDATSRPPTRVLPEPNVRVAYCPYPARCNCQSHDLTCEKNRQSLEDIRGWLQRCPRQLYIFEYPRAYRCWYEPFGSFYSMTRRMHYYASTTIGGVGFCVAPENFRDLFLFVMGRLRWEPQADVERLVHEFMAAYYGQAAPAVQEYFDFLHREIDQRPVHQMCERANLGLVTPQFAARSLEVLTRAQTAVAGDPVRLARVDAEKFCILWADVQQRNTVNNRLAVDRAVFARRLGELVRIARDRKIERLGRTDLGLTPNWLSSVVGVKLVAEPWYTDPQVEQLIHGGQ